MPEPAGIVTPEPSALQLVIVTVPLALLPLFFWPVVGADWVEVFCWVATLAGTV